MKTLRLPFLLIAFNLAVVTPSLIAQQVLSWTDFSEITYEEKFDSSSQAIYMMPIFDNNLKAIDGKAVSIIGYLFPIDPASGYYILKADNEPFGCCMSHIGNPNEIIELRFENINPALLEKYSHKQITVVGNFELNANDMFALDLILDEASVVNK